MHTYINSFQVLDKKLKTFKVFGYTSKGIPGIELVGFGPKGRLVKEKVIYQTKLYGLKVTNKKYVICLDEVEARSLNPDEVHWFELPVLLLFWTLAEALPLKNINDCFCSGKTRMTGDFVTYQINEEANHFFQSKNGVLINKENVSCLQTINLSELLEDFKVNCI